MVKEILMILTHLKNKNCNISFEWIPAHCGIQGNEIADKCAKSGINGPIQIVSKKTLEEAKHELSNKMLKEWQEKWETSHALLKNVLPRLPTKFRTSLPRKEEKIIRRLRFGVIGLNYDSYRLGFHENGFCERCQVIETVYHFLVVCLQYTIERAMLMMETGITEGEEIMELLKSVDIFTQRALVRYVYRTARFIGM